MRFETPAFGGGFFLLVRQVVEVAIKPPGGFRLSNLEEVVGDVVEVVVKLASQATNRLMRCWLQLFCCLLSQPHWFLQDDSATTKECN